MKKTKAEQRVVLARDVLKQLNLGAYRAHHGVYVGGLLYDFAYDMSRQMGLHPKTGRYDYVNKDVDMRDLITKGNLKGASCSVCAKGALFMAHILRNDKVTVGEFVSTSLAHTRNRVENKGDANPIPTFTPRQLDEIEVLFEGKGFVTNGEWTAAQSAKLYAALKRIGKVRGKNRLIKVMKLVIRNKGKKIVL